MFKKLAEKYKKQMTKVAIRMVCYKYNGYNIYRFHNSYDRICNTK